MSNKTILRRALSLATLCMSVALTGCGDLGPAQDTRPQTYGDACHEYGVVQCALAERNHVCEGFSPEQLGPECPDHVVALDHCCGVDGAPSCDEPAPADMPFMSYDSYATCTREARTAECAPLATAPPSCDGAFP
ncbi:MAG TPA: hypothetical protein VGM90_08755 [Kofleriaceae bacterium]|jgi:hypothetical protein